MSKSLIVSPKVFTRNVLTNWGSHISYMIVAFFLTPYILYKLGAVNYGVWSLVNSVVGYFGLIDMGIRGSVGRYVNYYMAREDTKSFNEVIATSIVFLTIICAFILVISYFLSVKFHIIFKKTPVNILENIRIILPVLAISIWIRIVSSIFFNVINALDRFDVRNGIQILILCIQTIGIVVVLSLGHGLVGMSYVVLIANMAGAIMCFFSATFLNKSLKLSIKFARMERFLEIWKYGIASFLKRLANNVIYQSDNIIVMIFLGPSMVAIYSIASMLIQNGQKFIENIGTPFFPSVMKSGSLRDFKGLQKMFKWYARLAFYFGTVLYMGFIVFGREFIELWVGPTYIEAATVLTILAVADLFSILSSNGGSVLFSLGKLRFNIVSSSLEAIANIGITLLLVGLLGFGIGGVALGTLISMISVRAIAYPLYTSRQIELSYSDYFLTIGAKAVFIMIFSFVLFRTISGNILSTGWDLFFIKVIIATLLYSPVAAFLMFGKDECMFFVYKIFTRIRNQKVSN